jgi:hypothetical protein
MESMGQRGPKDQRQGGLRRREVRSQCGKALKQCLFELEVR